MSSLCQTCRQTHLWHLRVTKGLTGGRDRRTDRNAKSLSWGQITNPTGESLEMPRATGLSFSVPGLSCRNKNQAGDCGGHKVEGQDQVQTDEWVAHSNLSSQHQQCRWSGAEASLSRAETVLNFLPMSPLTHSTPDGQATHHQSLSITVFVRCPLPDGFQVRWVSHFPWSCQLTSSWACLS